MLQRRSRPLLAFDDGPSEYTEPILDALARSSVAAAFFVQGSRAERYPGLVQRAAAEGHYIGNHTWSHPRLPTLAALDIAAEFVRTGDLLEGLLGARPYLYRPPYGVSTIRVKLIASYLRLRPLLCDVDSRDWTRPGADAIQAVMCSAPADATILLHDGGGNRQQTVEAVSRFLS